MICILTCALLGYAGIGDGLQAQPAGPAPLVARADPPSWWPGHSLASIRLLVRGESLAGARVHSGRDDVRPGDTRVNDRGTALLVDLEIRPDAAAGAVPLRVETGRGTTPIPFRLEPTLNPATFPGGRGIGPDDVAYLIMTDRFANGDPANDVPPGSTAAAHGRSKPRGYHGGDLRGVIDHLPYLQQLGVTAIWLTPWYDNFNGLYECDKPWCPYSYYHGYHAIDHYAVEDHFGTLETLRELVALAHARGIKVIQDQVCNQVSLHHPWIEDPPLPTWLHGTPACHSPNPFLLDILSSPHTPPAVKAPVLDGWFSDDSPDLNQDEPEVARYLIQNALWWVGMTGIDAVREDTAQYIPRGFLRDLCGALHRQHPRLTLVAEVLDLDPVHTSFFLGGRAGWDGIDTGVDQLFDFPVWWSAANVFSGKQPMTDLRKVLRADSLYPDASRLLPLTANHDVPRFLSFPGASLAGAKLQMAFILTLRGTPQIYYGDEIGIQGKDDPDNRRDFPGGFPGDRRSAFEPSGRTPDEQAMFTWTREWIALRKAHPALRWGKLLDLACDPDVFVFARKLKGETIVIALNRSAVPRSMSFPAAGIDAVDGAALKPLLHAPGSVIASGARFTLTLSPASAAAYRLD